MTRAGKGQSIIEPTIDAWSRMDRKCNIIINDPKEELHLRFYYKLRVRGFNVVVFNLMNSDKTNIYNPLGYAISAARKDDSQQTSDFVKQIGDVFFPPDKADDPMWPNAANAAFQQTALLLIDIYLEEEREMTRKSIKENWSQEEYNIKIDELWGHVTLYNVYEMMTELASKKSDDPKLIKIGDDDVAKEKDYLTLLMDATKALPENSSRKNVQHQNESLRAMSQSEKTIASVYGISLTAIKFFADETIAGLTSGRPSQNFDIEGLAFPRRFEVRFDINFAKKHSYIGKRYVWTAYGDNQWSKPLGDKFNYSNTIKKKGWATYYTKGIFKNRYTYFTLDVINSKNKLLMKRYYLRFTKGYQTSLNGHSYEYDEVLHSRIVKDGLLEEFRPQVKNGHKRFIKYNSTYSKLIASILPTDDGQLHSEKMRIISQIDIHYSEEPQAVFTVTPPHSQSYNKIMLIFLNQEFNMQVAKAYGVWADQQPVYITMHMLDEAGNLQSEGKGIPGLQTKMSIGLGQGQYYSATSCIVKSYAT